MERLFVLYDARCGLCRWIKDWASGQSMLVPLVFVPAGSSLAGRLASGISTAGSPEELVVVSDRGELYRGDSAWIMCFYALEDYREWSLRLASPALRPLARKAFALLSRGRVRVSDWLGLSDRDAVVILERVEAPACEIGGAASTSASGLRSIHEMLAARDANRGDGRPGGP